MVNVGECLGIIWGLYYPKKATRTADSTAVIDETLIIYYRKTLNRTKEKPKPSTPCYVLEGTRASAALRRGRIP